jgi:hypothetical protein
VGSYQYILVLLPKRTLVRMYRMLRVQNGHGGRLFFRPPHAPECVEGIPRHQDPVGAQVLGRADQLIPPACPRNDNLVQ